MSKQAVALTSATDDVLHIAATDINGEDADG